MDGALYEHTNRPKWGVAILAWISGDRRGYQFEDGQLRAIHRDYVHLLRSAALPAEEASRRYATLVRLLGHEPGLGSAASSRRAAKPLGFEFHHQVKLFRRLFPDGFSGLAWRRERRGGGKRALKRHRDPAIARAQELLGQETLQPLLEAERFEGVLERLRTVLEGTDLVSASQRRLLEIEDDAVRRRLATWLFDLLHGDGALALRFERYVGELGPSVGWSIATTPLALVHSAEHVGVRSTVFNAQARLLVPHLQYTKRPTATLYDGYRAMTIRARDVLREEGLSPADLLDVHDFFRVTLRPKSVEQLKAMASADVQADVSVPADSETAAA